MVPIQSILGKLPLVPVGNTGTIPFEPSACTRAEQPEREAIAEEFYPGAYCDSAKGFSNGCRPWHVNSFALEMIEVHLRNMRFYAYRLNF